MTATALKPGPIDQSTTTVDALTPEDVSTALLTAKEQGRAFAVEATGHGTKVSPDGGVMVNTSSMASVLVDPERRIARAGAGARWSEVVAAAAPFGLAPVTGNTLSVGVTGFTFGGGVGWLSRKYGFAADNLLRADIVTADGRHRTASATQEPDLFWAIRGGGGNFGIATSLEFRLHPVERLYGGIAYFPFTRAADVLAAYADPDQDEAQAVSIVLRKGPDGPRFAVRGAYVDRAERATKAMEHLWRAGGDPVNDEFREMTYAETATIGGTPPLQFELLETLSGAAVDVMIRAIADPESSVDEIEVRLWGGAMTRGTGPVGHRTVPYSVAVFGSLPELEPHTTGGSFLNFLGDTTRTATAYTPANYRRLREIKRAYDPANVLGLTHNIPPKG